MIPAQVSDEGRPFCAHRPILAEIPQLAQERVLIGLAPDFVELDLIDKPPLRMMHQAALGVVRRRQLPLIPSEDQSWQLTSTQPHLMQAVEMLLEELGRFIDDDEVIAQHHAHRFHQRFVKHEGAVANVQVCLRVPLLHAGPLHPSGHGKQDSGAEPLSSSNALVQNSRLARARRAQHGHHRAMLVGQVQEPIRFFLGGGVAHGQRLVHPLVDVVGHPQLIPGQRELVVFIKVGLPDAQRGLHAGFPLHGAVQVLLDEEVVGPDHLNDGLSVGLLVGAERHVLPNPRFVAPLFGRPVQSTG